jgi:hypothetical protein
MNRIILAALALSLASSPIYASYFNEHGSLTIDHGNEERGCLIDCGGGIEITNRDDPSKGGFYPMRNAAADAVVMNSDFDPEGTWAWFLDQWWYHGPSDVDLIGGPCPMPALGPGCPPPVAPSLPAPTFGDIPDPMEIIGGSKRTDALGEDQP